MKPIIGITAGFNYPEGRHFLTDYYIEAIGALGGVPVIIPAMDGQLALEFYNRVDGLIFSGGGDLDPQYFGQEPLRGIGEINPKRDGFEMALAKLALTGKKPILGICRGMQLLNIAAGGNIYQDIKNSTSQEHDQKAPKWYPYHQVNIALDTMLYNLLGQDKIKVNSFHHQAVKNVGAGLQPVAWSSDGLVEAIEGIDRNKKVLGVQWHPECSWDRDPLSLAIFTILFD